VPYHFLDCGLKFILLKSFWLPSANIF